MAVQEVKNPLLSKITIGAEGDLSRSRSKIEEVLAQKEKMAASRFSAAEMEKLAIESENDVAKMRGEPPLHKPVNDDDKEKKEEAEKKDEQRRLLIETGKALLDTGIDPKQVGQILMGLAPMPGQPGIPQVVGITIEDAFAVADRIAAAGQKSQADEAITKLEKRFDDVTKQLELERRERQLGLNGKPVVPLSPADALKSQIDALKSFADTAIELGLAQRPGTNNGNKDGKSIEEIRENNRHDEEMAKLKDSKEHNEKMADILGSIPERVGNGIATQIRKNSQLSGNPVGFSSIKCDCGTEILITPTTGNKVTCPKCGAVYENGDKPEVLKPEAGNATKS